MKLFIACIEQHAEFTFKSSIYLMNNDNGLLLLKGWVENMKIQFLRIMKITVMR